MKPLGRKNQRTGDHKHRVKEDGKNIKGWWEDMIPPCKRADRQQSKRDVQEDINNDD